MKVKLINKGRFLQNFILKKKRNSGIRTESSQAQNNTDMHVEPRKQAVHKYSHTDEVYPRSM